MGINKLTPTRLAELIGVQQPHISACLNGSRNIGKKTIGKVCEALGISEEEFFKIEAIGVSPPGRMPRSIPIISWVQAGELSEAADVHAVGFSGEGEPVHSVKAVGPNAFALRVVGDSMAPRYLPGDIIVVDPALACDNGCPCVVNVNGDVTFKIFRDTQDEIILEPLNKRHPKIVIDKKSDVVFRVVGKVVDMIPKL